MDIKRYSGKSDKPKSCKHHVKGASKGSGKSTSEIELVKTELYSKFLNNYIQNCNSEEAKLVKRKASHSIPKSSIIDLILFKIF